VKQDHPVISVFGSSRALRGDVEYELARLLGEQLARAGFIVCNGGYGGTMEASARGAKEANGTTIGVVCRLFGNTANPYIDTMIMTESLGERLAKLVELGSAYVVLRGGTGTLLELATVWEYMNKHIIPEKAIITVGSFWSPTVTTMKQELAEKEWRVAAGFVHEAVSPHECIELLLKNRRIPPLVEFEPVGCD
jgi:uncharacterized protein (TIGR00725 family)